MISVYRITDKVTGRSSVMFLQDHDRESLSEKILEEFFADAPVFAAAGTRHLCDALSDDMHRGQLDHDVLGALALEGVRMV